eukprot:TRINITY_DN2157_c0_g1_i1.p1 TRINITY_DN2157_c0_g1~~TRINITY_DN2157_c0_g1_i1.p1  ORF type:complete len:186 (-),score=22.07 TRINITY_DN2157_c0_g1_i1:148-705(-)
MFALGSKSIKILSFERQTRQTIPHRRLIVRASAEPTTKQDKNDTDLSIADKVGKITFIKDEETTADLFSIQGPLIERAHGRLAMWGFLFGMIGELTSHGGIVSQLQSSYISILVTNGLIFLGSVAPKYSAGVSLQTLQDAAEAENGSYFVFFNNVFELWIGRVAMLGMTGLILVEILKGGALIQL